jgi:hypothetical protein
LHAYGTEVVAVVVGAEEVELPVVVMRTRVPLTVVQTWPGGY